MSLHKEKRWRANGSNFETAMGIYTLWGAPLALPLLPSGWGPLVLLLRAVGGPLLQLSSGWIPLFQIERLEDRCGHCRAVGYRCFKIQSGWIPLVLLLRTVGGPLDLSNKIVQRIIYFSSLDLNRKCDRRYQQAPVSTRAFN